MSFNYNPDKDKFQHVLKQAIADSFTTGDNKFSGRFGIFQALDDDEMLEDEEINSAIPDFIEKKIYKNVFKLIIKVMKSFTQSSKMSFLGQEISIKIDPKNNDL